MYFLGMEGLLEQMKDHARTHSHKIIFFLNTKNGATLKQIGLNIYFRAEHKQYIIIYSRDFG